MKKFLLKFWPILVILSVWLVFASPYFLKDKVPFPSTYLVNNFSPWNAYPELAGPIKNNATPDVIVQIYPWKKLVIDLWKQGVVPLWNPYGFSGTPLLANYQAAALSPLNLLYFALPYIDAWSIQILLQPLLAGIFMYLFLRSLKIEKEGAVLGAVSFMFCGFITSWMVYGTLGYAIVFLPLALLAIEHFYESKKWYYLALLTFTVPLSFFSGHFQTSLYFLLFIIGYLLFKAITVRNIKTTITAFLSILSGVLISAPQLLPSMEFYENAVRSAIFMKIEVIPWSYLPSFIAPDFFGNPVTRNDWFGHYAEWNAYAGLIPIVLAIYTIGKKNAYITFFILMAVITILLSFQTPLLDLLVTLKIPVLSTSAASRIIVIFSFCTAALGAFGFEQLLSDIHNKRFKKILFVSLIISAIFIILWIVVLLKLFIPQDKIFIALSNLKLPTIIFGSFFTAVLITFLARSKKVIFIFAVIVILLTGFDMLRFATKWQPFDPRSLMYPKVSSSEFLSSFSIQDRAFGNFGQELSLVFRISGLEGYDPLYIGRYGEFMNAARDGEFHAGERSVVSLSKNGKYTEKVINFLGVKHIIHKVADGRNVWAFPYWTYPAGQFNSVFKDSSLEIFENSMAYPRAFIVPKYEVRKTNREQLKAIFNSDLQNVAVLEEQPQGLLSGSGSAEIKIYEANKIEIETNANAPALLVLSDPFYPGWKATIDGQETKIYRTNYAFRSVAVPGGRHSVRFTYEPSSFKIGLLLSIIGVIGMLIISKTKLLRK